jgi:hypothetical protein
MLASRSTIIAIADDRYVGSAYISKTTLRRYPPWHATPGKGDAGPFGALRSPWAWLEVLQTLHWICYDRRQSAMR